MVENKLMFSKLFSDQSCVNRTKTVHGTLRFVSCFYLTYCMKYVKIFIMNLFISKSFTTTKN